MKTKTINRLSQITAAKKIDYCRMIDRIIKDRSTGTIQDIAKQMQISGELASELLDYMTLELKCPIDFCFTQNSYIYSKKGKFFAGFLMD